MWPQQGKVNAGGESVKKSEGKKARSGVEYVPFVAMKVTEEEEGVGRQENG